MDHVNLIWHLGKKNDEFACKELYYVLLEQKGIQTSKEEKEVQLH